MSGELCPRCGREMLAAFEPATSVLYRCPACGHETKGVIVSVPASAPAPRVRVYVLWNRDGTEARQVGALRRLFPELQNRPLAELVSAAATEESSLLGEL